MDTDRLPRQIEAAQSSLYCVLCGGFEWHWLSVARQWGSYVKLAFANTTILLDRRPIAKNWGKMPLAIQPI